MPGAVSMMTCGGCGKSVPWKPQYAGKRLRCKCGFAMIGPPEAPAGVALKAAKSSPAPIVRAAAPQKAQSSVAPPPPPDASGSDDPFEQLVSQAEEYAFADEPKPAQDKAKSSAYRRPRPPTAQPMAGRTAPAVAAPAVAMLGYARAVPKQPDENALGDTIKEIFIPLALIMAGLIGEYYAAYIRGLHNPLTMTVYAIFNCAFSLFLIFTAVMIAVNVVGLGLGNIGPAALKICAVALLPGAIADIVSYYVFGASTIFLSWGATLLMYYVLLLYLFDLDGQELRITCLIIWGMKWISFFLFLALLAGMGLHVRARGSGSRGSSLIISAANPTAAPSPPPKTPDQFMADEIKAGNAVDFRTWFKPGAHGVNEGSKQAVAKQCEDYYAAGAKKVWAYDIAIRDKQLDIQACSEMVIELPDDPKAAEKVRAALGFDSPGQNPDDPDMGKHFIRIPLDQSAVRATRNGRGF